MVGPEDLEHEIVMDNLPRPIDFGLEEVLNFFSEAAAQFPQVRLTARGAPRLRASFLKYRAATIVPCAPFVLWSSLEAIPLLVHNIARSPCRSLGGGF